MLFERLKKINSIVAGLFFFGVVLTPAFVLAQSSASSPVTGITWDCAVENIGRAPGECTFVDLVGATKRLVNWGTLFALEFCVIVIAWAGFNYMISGANPGKRTAANKTLWTALKGLGFILGAWLLVTLITSALGVDVSTFFG